jgi:hypothetical protein
MNARFSAKDTSTLQSAIAAYLNCGGVITDCNTTIARNSAQLGRGKRLHKSDSMRSRMRGRAI